uniref:Mechanosensitive ion channel n=1 Tax=Roseihalotalea indica TaxID=2867963 RepID=A0AA49GRC2_9BACT|nr:mechanosensitive ion channel [Tunicatimonas sp. TK19036]
MPNRRSRKPLSSQSNRSANQRSPTNRHRLRRRKRGTSTTTRRQRGSTVQGAQNQLKRFTQASILAIAVTGFLLLLLAPSEAGYLQDEDSIEVFSDSADAEDTTQLAEDEDSINEAEEDSPISSPQDVGEAAKNEALITLQNLWEGFYSNLPKILVALVALLITWALVKLLRILLHRLIGHWKNASAIMTLTSISLWLLAVGLAVSVVAGDIRALLGSLGLVGLALSWSLQTPIESFTGWLLNSFQGYYRVGDRISVGEVFGDVYKIDFLTTTVWEIGAPYRDGFVQAEQPTGRLVTFPNNEVLAGTIVNLTGDFPFVWDELAIAVANESDLAESMQVIERVANELLGDYMKAPTQQYERILRQAHLNYSVSAKPELYVSLNESWTDIVVRYLVGARERRTWKSQLSLKIMEELNRLEHKGKIKSVYPRQQVQFVNASGEPDDVTEIKKKQQKPDDN